MPWTAAATRATGFKVTAAVWNAEHVDNMNFLREVAYQEFQAPVNVTATTVGGANQIVQAGSVTYESVPHMVEFFAPNLATSTGTMFLVLRDGTTVLGTWGRFVANDSPGEAKLSRRVIPSIGAHNYNVAGWLSAAGTWNINAGNGGTAGDTTTYLPGFIRVTRIPT